MQKTFLQTYLSCSMQKTALENSLYWKNESILKIAKNWPQCKGFSPCEILSLGQKIKLPKTYEKHFHKHIKVFVCKKTAGKNS